MNGNIILEVKGVTGIADEFVAQAINYLKVSQNKLALIVNFGELKLKTTKELCFKRHIVNNVKKGKNKILCRLGRK